MRILFMGTPDWAVPTLEALVDSLIAIQEQLPLASQIRLT